MSNSVLNKVAQSGIIQLDPEDFFPKEEIVLLDMKSWLYHELILREADFRAQLESFDWSVYQDKIVCLICSADAIVPLWAYMLFVTRLKPVAHDVFYGDKTEYLKNYYREIITHLDTNIYQDKRIVIKGCGDKPVPPSAYVDLTNHLMPYAKSIMFGEPCSTVPVYKAPKITT